jgi:hypothetical protein
LRPCHTGNPVADYANRLLECINVLEITLRHPDLVCIRIDMLDLVAPLRNLLRGWMPVFPYFIFERFDLAIPDNQAFFYACLRHARQCL